MVFRRGLAVCGGFFLASYSYTTSADAFLAKPSSVHCRREISSPASALCMSYGKYGNGRSSSRYGTQDRSKRQERVGHVVRTELASIIQRGYPVKHDDNPIEDELRRRISVVNADVSPDLRQARVTVSIIARAGQSTSAGDSAVDKRRAYAWLVRCTNNIKHALAQRMKHMKTVPNLTFVQADVGAAVDVMHLIDKVSQGYKRDNLGEYAEYVPRGMVMGMDFDDDDDDGWVDEDNIDDDDDGWVDEDEEEKSLFP